MIFFPYQKKKAHVSKHAKNAWERCQMANGENMTCSSGVPVALPMVLVALEVLGVVLVVLGVVLVVLGVVLKSITMRVQLFH